MRFRLTTFAYVVVALTTRPVAAQVEPPPVPAGRVPAPGAYLPDFDVLHYSLRLRLPAEGQRIEGRATLDIARRMQPASELRLDLSGLRVNGVRAGELHGAMQAAAFRQDDGRLFVTLPPASRNDTVRVEVAYDGVPDDGLILRTNVRGAPSVFADNWPDRARFWFPSVDHPSDKATVAYEVIAPAGWSVIANGRRTDAGEDTIWNYEVRVPIPTYTMVVGATRMTVGTIDSCARGETTTLRPDGCVAVTSWTFPQDSATGARIFARAGDMIRYYTQRFGPFPYEKLAHVQSATRFGGMENVGAIFYSEQAIADGTLGEVTVAHETLHQWFGDAVTPGDWPHLWLSEGFATYFGMQYFEEADGVQAFRELLAASGQGYLGSDVTGLAIVDTLRVPENNLFALLNANSYNKGGQVLHMLRGLAGDEAFFSAVRSFYEQHLHQNAQTRELQDAFERATGQDLDWFFDQWVYRPGHPILQVTSEWDERTSDAVITLQQVQPDDWPTFRMPVELELVSPGGRIRQRVDMRERQTRIRVPLPGPVSAVIVDPDGWLLKEVRSAR